MKLLLVEDEEKMARLLQRGLTEAGPPGGRVPAAARTRWSRRGRSPTTCVLLDWALPDLDGLAVLRRWREQGLRTPVLMLTARGTVGEKVTGLRAGADDYLVKPFDFEELLARLEALHRRGDAQGPAQQVGPLVLDSRRRVLRHGEREESLTAREFALCSELASHVGEVLSRSHAAQPRVGRQLRRAAQRRGRVRGLPARQAEEAGGGAEGVHPDGAREWASGWWWRGGG